MTTDWSNTWAGANGWYDGYDSTNTGSFVDISALSGAERDAAISAVRENIIGLLEQKGVTRAQILDPTSDVGQFYQQQMTNAASGSDNATRNAFQAAAQHTTSGTDRGNTWGADDDATIGRTYLDSIAAGGTATVMDLYNKGFGRTQAEMAEDTTGPQYWDAKLSSGEMTIQEIAAFFAQSEEANIRDIYADQYNRDADWSGLKYWEAETEGDDSATLLNAVQYRGANPDWVQNETAIRDAGWEYLGQASNQDQRDTMPTLGDNKLFTAMSNTEVANWMSKISSGEMTLEEVIGGAQIDSDGNVVSGSGGELYNRGDYNLNDFYAGTWLDPDLGFYLDDYVGCDVQRGLGYCYNADAIDNDGCGSWANPIGEYPPAVGVDFFEGPYQDNDGIANPLTTDVSQAISEKGIPYSGLGIGYGDTIVDNERYGMNKCCKLSLIL